MDDADLAARQRLLAEPLGDVLRTRWPRVQFAVDATAATDRPGEPVVVGWDDGPSAEDVTVALRPRWCPDPLTSSAGEPGPNRRHPYPVTLRREYSPAASAAAILVIYDAGALAEAVAAGRHGFGDVLLRWLGGQQLPAGLGHDLRARAELLAEIAETTLGHTDAFEWARWLTHDGTRVLSHVLPGALTETSGS